MKIDHETLAKFARIYEELRSSPTYRVEGFKIEVEEALYALNLTHLTSSICDEWPDEERDYTFMWEDGEMALYLIIPYDLKQSPHIYWSEGERYGGCDDVSPESIRKWIAWFAKGGDAQ